MVINHLHLPTELIRDVKNGDWTEGQFDRQIRSLLENYNINLDLDIHYYDGATMLSETNAFSRIEFQDKEQFELLLGARSTKAEDRTIDPRRIILIADFGLGSDQPIGLDYRRNPDEPEVWCLIWPENKQKNYWTRIATSYGNFKRGKM
ncbi:hypothetical protein [Flavilitoribacter nigricans]|uniref:SMI1/KNR4 family protein n=1 Tax=Flavilitoribacter nigricans (strain ATCC 23147 / DSM 23189 / NBRC 102662 / NCIMB 1420 / SS-2) TaxID=1122177 RepID=A0A2D0MYP4_FLAN2|nr:hypothetical protein [Flavilitoribacter nigricans]PHN01375.1 hypothetical protein CRP01_37555 [Flavilitoribacter nigricans DSM 23189 = NBRC 102662]